MSHEPTSKTQQISFRSALAFWLKLGFISFGGPSGQIAIMHTELVERRRWISERRFLHALNYCMLLPGPEAQQLATYIGWLLHGTRGGLAAGALFVLPSLLILIGLSWIYMAFGDVPVIAGILDGMKPAVVAIVAFAAYRIGSRVLSSASTWLMATAAFSALYFFDVPFPYLILVAALLGIVIGKFAPQWLHAPPTTHAADSHEARALIDDADPTPAHARFRWSRALTLMGWTVALWIAVLALLVAIFGRTSPFVSMSVYFTKAALLTFGGAYAVLPYVQQAAVEQFRWLTAGQMIDGLALGETTPGPLIMVVAFVGFVGGWTQAPAELTAPIAAVLAACVATFFTFLPSFAFIFIGAPAIEATRDELSFTAPLTMITAAVVGVILNLAVYFAEHVLWSATATVSLGSLNVFAALLCTIALVALVRFKANVMLVILGCALAGFARTFLQQLL